MDEFCVAVHWTQNIDTISYLCRSDVMTTSTLILRCFKSCDIWVSSRHTSLEYRLKHCLNVDSTFQANTVELITKQHYFCFIVREIGLLVRSDKLLYAHGILKSSV